MAWHTHRTFQEHTGGAKAMIEDGLYDKIPVPDIALGQQSDPMRTGKINIRSGPVLVAVDTYCIRVFDPPVKTSNPQAGLDPGGLAAWIVVRLNSIVSTGISPLEFAVITCEEFHPGQQGLDYVDYADIGLDVKSYKPHIREQFHRATKSMVTRKCKVAGADRDLEIKITQRAPLTSNDPELVATLPQSFKEYFKENLSERQPRKPCEDSSILASSQGKPCVFWFFGTVDATKWDKAEQEGKLGEVIAQNHSPFYAPSLHPTMKTGVDALALGALTFLM